MNYFSKLFILFTLFTTFFSCQPKADYDVITEPMNGFAFNMNDSARGAKSIKDLSCYFFVALQSQISFEQFKKFIPDSSDIAAIYNLTQTQIPSGNFLKANADTVMNRIQNGFNSARSKPAVLHSDWKDASLVRVMVIEIEDQKLPSKKIVIEATDGKTTLRASAKCMQIGDRWFIGEDIRYGV